ADNGGDGCRRREGAGGGAGMRWDGGRRVRLRGGRCDRLRGHNTLSGLEYVGAGAPHGIVRRGRPQRSALFLPRGRIERPQAPDDGARTCCLSRRAELPDHSGGGNPLERDEPTGLCRDLERTFTEPEVDLAGHLNRDPVTRAAARVVLGLPRHSFVLPLTYMDTGPFVARGPSGSTCSPYPPTMHTG